MKTIAVITGASQGIGKEFADRISEYGRVDEVWAIARSLDKLEALKESVPFPVRPISLDLSKEESFSRRGKAVYKTPYKLQRIRKIRCGDRR